MNEQEDVKKVAINEDEFFSSEDTKTMSGWFKFVNIGDRIVGTLITKTEQETPGFSPQIVFTIETPNGDIMNVAVKKTQYFITRANQCSAGDIVGFQYMKEIPPQQKGHKPGKQIEMRIKKTENSGFSF